MEASEETEKSAETNGAPAPEEGASPSAPAAAAAKPTKAARPKAEKQLPTERIAFGKQLDLVRAYGQLGAKGAASTAEVAKVVDIHPSTASLANPFFTDAGFLQRSADGFAPAQDVVAYARAYEWAPETAAHKLAPLVSRSWFAEALLPKLRFKPHARQQALTVLAEAGGATTAHKGQLETLLEYLEVVGLISLDGDTVKAIRAQTPEEEESPPKPPGGGTAKQPPPATAGAFQISMSITLAEIATLPPDRIQAFLEGLTELMKIHAEIEAAKRL